jgi:hypothetical protein
LVNAGIAGGVLVNVVVVVVGTDVSDKDGTDDKHGTVSLLLQLYTHLQHLPHSLFQRHTPVNEE